jgi:hypothetical protein
VTFIVIAALYCLTIFIEGKKEENLAKRKWVYFGAIIVAAIGIIESWNERVQNNSPDFESYYSESKNNGESINEDTLKSENLEGFKTLHFQTNDSAHYTFVAHNDTGGVNEEEMSYFNWPSQKKTEFVYGVHSGIHNIDVTENDFMNEMNKNLIDKEKRAGYSSIESSVINGTVNKGSIVINYQRVIHESSGKPNLYTKQFFFKNEEAIEIECFMMYFEFFEEDEGEVDRMVNSVEIS